MFKKILIVIACLLALVVIHNAIGLSNGSITIDPPRGTLDGSPTSTLSKERLEEIQSYLDNRNEQKDFPQRNSETNPQTVGKVDGQPVVVDYWCSDVCPDNGILFLNYASSTEETCDQLGGYKLYKWGWGLQYIGCSPTENTFSD